MAGQTPDKQILRLHIDGTITVLDAVPTWDTMRQWVGGFLEQVRVLRDDGVYTFMYVNEEGLINGLPRNQAATERYQHNVRTAFPGPKPFAAAVRVAAAKAALMGAHVLRSPEPAPGYNEDPWIAGEAIYFAGWTCAELTAYWNRTRREEVLWHDGHLR